MEELNFLSLPASALLALLGGPFLLRKAGYPAGKTVFGVLTGTMVLLAAWGVLSTVQHKAGIETLPLGWLVPLGACFAAWRFRDRL
ncbi:MAG TPA: hypothetical protein VL974_06465 [Magnetospirillum sp.]|jgi:hypothetical protein|nr:hypothetical protein [Magnetospirillum sp.]